MAALLPAMLRVAGLFPVLYALTARLDDEAPSPQDVTEDRACTPTSFQTIVDKT